MEFYEAIQYPPTLCNWERLCRSDGSLGEMGDAGDACGGMEGVTCRRKGWWAWESTRDGDTLPLH